jgi:hypothetical protein
VGRRFLCLALLSAAAVIFQTAAAQDDASENIARCLARLPSEVSGFDAIIARCPDLEAALAHAGYLELIPWGEREEFDSDSLYELQQLIEREVGERAAGFDRDSLDEVLASLEQPSNERPLNAFDRFKRWLRERLGANQAGESTWLSRWLDRIELPESFGEWLLYGLVILTVVAAAAVVLNEARVAGWLRARRSAQVGGSPGLAPSIDLLGNHARDPASLLLQELVNILIRSGRLKFERSLTHRELSAAAQLDNVEQRAAFGELTALAERVLYGSQPTPREDEAVLVAGRALRAQLGEAGR